MFHRPENCHGRRRCRLCHSECCDIDDISNLFRVQSQWEIAVWYGFLNDFYLSHTRDLGQYYGNGVTFRISIRHLAKPSTFYQWVFWIRCLRVHANQILWRSRSLMYCHFRQHNCWNVAHRRNSFILYLGCRLLRCPRYVRRSQEESGKRRQRRRIQASFKRHSRKVRVYT